MPNRFLKLLLFSFFILVLFVSSNFVLAADPPPCECTSGPCCDGCYFRPSSSICDAWPEYSCAWGTGCGSDVGINTYTKFCSGGNAGCDGSVIESGWTVAYPCSEWQVCTGSSCACNSSCLETPTGPYPANNDENVKLPVTLMWNAVPGAQSYRYRIEGVTESATTTPYITIKNCTLKSNSVYSWQVRACCDTAGKSCGEWSNLWTFKTSLAPELLSPANNATSTSIPVNLDWCDVTNTQSWLLKIYIVENGNEACHPWLDSGGSCNPVVLRKEKRPPPYPSEETLYSEFVDQKGYFTKDTEYRWEIATCLREDGLDCSDFSQRWDFKTSGFLPSFRLLSPPNDPTGNRAVGLPVTLDWEDKPGINSYIYEINNATGTVSSSQLFFGYPKLSLDTLYKWKVKPCWDYAGRTCETDWSEEWYFKTTGAPPDLLSPEAEASDVVIPAKLNWQDVSGANSYYYEIATTSDFAFFVATGTSEISEVMIDYPKLKMLTDYWWRIKTCTGRTETVCGEWSETRKLKTFKLSAPSNPSPEDGGELFTYDKYLSWSQVPGAKSYQYTIDYDSDNPPADEKKEVCPNLAGTKIVPPQTISSPSILLGLECLGKYRWSARACLDKDCLEPGDWAGPWSFNLVQGAPSEEKGLVPCGRISDNPDTPWNERDPCQFKHIFLLIKNILDFVLWRLGLIVLVLLTLAVGVIYYFSMGTPTTMVRVKSILKSAGMGYGIVFLSWIIINLILAILGFQVGIFGNWWQINF